jgi:hypothetical protein
MSTAAWIVPRTRSPWAEAMRSELQQIDDDLEALTWAIGCCVSSFKLFVTESLMKRPLTISFALSFVLGAALWGLSSFMTGHVEPWDANSAFYFAALFGSGLIVGALCPRQIWPIWPGIALGQFAYMLVFLPKGPLIAVGLWRLPLDSSRRGCGGCGCERKSVSCPD